MCRINISAVTGERINNTNQVDSVAVAARVSRDCDSVTVEVFESNGFLPLFPTATVQPNGTPIDPSFPALDPANDDTIVAHFSLSQASIPGVAINCGAAVRIRITCTTPGCNCNQDDLFDIACKTLDPDSVHPGPGGNGNNNGSNNGGITWPSWFCPFTARAFALILWLTLIGVALGVAGTGWIPQPLINAGIVAASIFLAAWVLICQPSFCAILRIITLVFMIATLATFVLALGFTDFIVAALAACYGGITALLVSIMKSHHCRVPRFP